MDATESATTRSAMTPSVSLPEPRSREGHKRKGYADAVYHSVSLAVSLVLVVTLVAIVAVLLSTAWPAIGQLGLGIITGQVWNPGAGVQGVFGGLAFVVGTVLTTALALLIAVPVSLAIAILLGEYAPRPVASVLGVVVEVAAGVPTIVFGAWALLVLVPFLGNTIEPAIAPALGWLPPLDPNNSPVGISGFGMFTAGLVLSAMVFPTIVAVTRTSLLATAPELREASLGIGATRWETATRVVLREARGGIIGAVVLASGRALGETMAVVYVIGGQPRVPQSLFDEGSTLSAQLFTQVYGGNAIPGQLNTAALYELGLVLLLLSLLTGLGGRLLTRRFAGAALAGVGR